VRRGVGLLVVACVCLAGCGAGSAPSTPTPTSTPTSTQTPVPTPTATPTPPAPNDTDRDGLVDARERRLGTDPTDPDTDGDALLDGAEVAGRTESGYALDGADPLRKDLYLRVVVAENVPNLTDRERASLRRIWTEMPVANPSGGSGVDLHLSVERAAALDPPESSSRLSVARDRHYGPDVAGRCVVHVAVVTEFPDGGLEIEGRASAPGHMSVVDGTETANRSVLVRGETSVRRITLPAPGPNRTPYVHTRTRTRTPHELNHTERVGLLVHEVLHNVVGKLPNGDAHPRDGWLSSDDVTDDPNVTLSPVTRRVLSERGFATSARDGPQSC